MTPNEVILASLPEGIRREKIICPCCGNIVQRTNYCSICDCMLPNNGNM